MSDTEDENGKKAVAEVIQHIVDMLPHMIVSARKQNMISLAEKLEASLEQAKKDARLSD